VIQALHDFDGTAVIVFFLWWGPMFVLGNASDSKLVFMLLYSAGGLFWAWSVFDERATCSFCMALVLLSAAVVVYLTRRWRALRPASGEG
jgi:hypothetical protein